MRQIKMGQPENPRFYRRKYGYSFQKTKSKESVQPCWRRRHHRTRFPCVIGSQVPLVCFSFRLGDEPRTCCTQSCSRDLKSMRVGGSEKRGHFGAFGAGWSAAFQNEPFSLIRRCCSERPGAVKGAPLLGAAKRTLDREDRSARLEQERKAQRRTSERWSQKMAPLPGATDICVRRTLCKLTTSQSTHDHVVSAVAVVGENRVLFMLFGGVSSACTARYLEIGGKHGRQPESLTGQACD
jgi:hypothetical protein